MSKCIHGIDLTEEYCDQGQCLTWQLQNVPHLVPKAHGGLLDPKPEGGLLDPKPEDPFEDIAKRLLARADAYEAPFGEDKAAFLQSNSYAIVTTLREIAFVLRSRTSDDLDST
jgi:hypothetical protein